MNILFLQAPSFEGFDGGAGSRYQARREIRSFWYPTWLAQAAAMVPSGKLIDAPPHGLTLDTVVAQVKDFDAVICHTSSPSFKTDGTVLERVKEEKPGLTIGLIGAKVAVDPEGSLSASRAIDFVAREEYDFTIKEFAEGMDFAAIKGITYRDKNGQT